MAVIDNTVVELPYKLLDNEFREMRLWHGPTGQRFRLTTEGGGALV